MVTVAQSAVNWRNTHTQVDRTHSLTHLQYINTFTTTLCEATAQLLQNWNQEESSQPKENGLAPYYGCSLFPKESSVNFPRIAVGQKKSDVIKFYII